MKLLPSEQELRDSWAEAIHRFLYGSYHYYYVFNADPIPVTTSSTTTGA